MSRTDPEVAAFLRDLDHPLKREIEAVRKIVLGVDPKISEGIKWNAPSFRTTEWFATLNLRGKKGEERVWMILHLGAKVRKSGAQAAVEKVDSTGLLTWLGKDRGLVTFESAKDVAQKKKALTGVLREWIRHVR